jgi:outer membrane biosynthesis protein TonB
LPDSKFEGLHYPSDVLTGSIYGLVEMAMKIDADGNLKELRMVSEYPPLVGFGRAAAEDFRVARFIPAFRDEKPAECSITLPVYYEPEAQFLHHGSGKKLAKLMSKTG